MTMPEREISVNIKKASNGYIVNCYNGKTDKTYIYKNLSDALEELESIFSVAKEEKEE